MSKAAEKSDQSGKTPAFLKVGGPVVGSATRARIGEAQLRKMFDWWNAMVPKMNEQREESIIIPLTTLAEELGMRRPTNANSFRANLQRAFDKMSIDGKTMFLALRHAGANNFEVLPETAIWFKPVPVAERNASKRSH